MAGTWKETGSTTKNGITTKTFTYTVDDKVVATLSGLKEDVVAFGGSISGITVTEVASGGTGTINLTGGVLTNSNVTLKLTNGGKYQLGLVDGGYKKVTPTDVTATVNNGTITFNGKLTEGYTLKNATTVTYSAAKNTDQKLSTITGLNTSLGVVGGKIGTTTTTGEGSEAVTTLNEELVTLDATTGVVTLKAGALAEGNAKLTINNTYSPYTTFALDSGVAAPEISSGSWVDTTNRVGAFTGVSTYTADVDTAGYTLSLDSKTVTYTGEGSGVGLVTVSGLANSSNINVSSTVDAKNNATITLLASALNQAAVKITKSAANFLLALDGDVNKSTVANTNIWAVSGANATYKTVKPEYYTYDSSTNAVSYTKQADVKTLATVKNLATGLTVDTDSTTGNSALYKDTNAVVTVNSSGVITLAADALTNKNVTLTNGTGESYSLALGTVTAPGVDSGTATTWAVKGTTATLSGKTTEGWAKTSDTLITYVAPNKTVALATVKGLKSGVAANTEKDAVGINSKDSSGTTVFTSGLSENSNVITVSANVLGTTNVTLTPAAGYSYSLELDTTNTAGGAVPTQAETKHFWYVKGKKLLLKDGKARYYTISTDKQTITETDEVVGSDVATVTGLKTGLKVSDGSIDGITVSGQLITVSKDVLNKATVSVTSTSNSKTYTLALANSNLKPHNDALWKIEGTTAVLQAGKTEGYTPSSDNKTLTYSGATTGTVLAEITGLKSGLKAVDYEIDGIVDTDFNFSNETKAKTITLSKKVLGTTDVTLTNKTNSSGESYNYSLAVDSTVTPIEVTREWRVGTGRNVGTAYYDVTTPRGGGFEEVTDDDDNVVQLAYKKAGTVTTTITGLKDTISTSNFTNPDDNGGVITLSSTVLGEKNATLKNASGGTYTLALGSGVEGPTITNTPTWEYDSKTKTTAYLKGAIDEKGWELSADALSVIYTPATDTDTDPDATSTLATVTGLKSGLTSAELNAGITRNGSVLTLTDSVLSGTKLTVKGGTYTLAIGNTDSTKANDLTEWVTSGTTANYKTYKTGYYTPDAKGTTVKYTAPTKGTTYATVKGIAKNVDINGAYTATSSASPTKGGTVTLTSDMLGTANVTLTGSGFSLALASGVPTSADNVTEWVTSGTTATYKNYNKAYYTKSGNTIKYTKPTGGTTYATIKGIASGATIESSNISTNASGNTVVTLNADQLAKKKVTISGSGYELALGSDVDKAELQGTYWTQAKNATSALYKADYSGGYTAANATTITYSANPTVTTLATVNGIVKNTSGELRDTREVDPTDTITGYSYDDANEFSDVGLTADTNTITVGTAAFPVDGNGDIKNGSVTLKSNDYTFASDITEPTEKDGTLLWTLNKKTGKAVYAQGYDAGATLSADKKTLTYSKEKTITLATISGLDANKLAKLEGVTWEGNEVSVDDDGLASSYGIQVSNNTIKLLNNTVLGTKNITLGKNDLFAFDASAVAPTAGSNKWAVSGTTAKYNKTTAAGYNATDTKVVKYVKEAVGDNIFTITGLKKGIKTDGSNVGFSVTSTVDNGDGTTTKVTSISDCITLVDSLNEVNLNPEVLGTTDIQLTNGTGNYHFAAEGLNAPSAPANVWTYSGTTATYKTVQDSGYTLDTTVGSSTYREKITYTAAKTTTLATVKGLSKTFTGNLEDEIVADDANETVTVNSGLLGTTNVTLALPKNASALYSLVIGSGIAQQANTATEWVTAGTKANYKTYAQAYYTTDPTTGAIVYHKPTAGTTYATISGIKSGVDINSASAVTDGTVGGTITLTAAMLGTSKVTVANAKGNTSATYTLALAGDVPTSSTKATGWVTTGTTANYRTEYDKATYALANNAITYTKGASNGTETATIKGANGDLTATLLSDGKTFSLTSDGLSNKITLATTATEGESNYAFSFNTTYNNANITGSANADIIAVAGDRLTVTGGKGNDTITFGTESRSGNLFIYANGDGEDTIVNFQEKDALQIKSGFKPAEYNGGTTIPVGSGSIELSGYTGSTVTINGKSYDTGLGSSNVLLADDNYSMDAANLSSLVQADISSYTPYDFTSNFSLTKEDKLTPQISYSGNDK